MKGSCLFASFYLFLTKTTYIIIFLKLIFCIVGSLSGTEGPNHDVQWSYSGSEFADVYGCNLHCFKLVSSHILHVNVMENIHILN